MPKKVVVEQSEAPANDAQDAFQVALEADQSGVKALYTSGVIDKETAIQRMRRTQALPETL